MKQQTNVIPLRRQDDMAGAPEANNQFYALFASQVTELRGAVDHLRQEVHVRLQGVEKAILETEVKERAYNLIARLDTVENKLDAVELLIAEVGLPTVPERFKTLERDKDQRIGGQRVLLVIVAVVGFISTVLGSLVSILAIKGLK